MKDNVKRGGTAQRRERGQGFPRRTGHYPLPNSSVLFTYPPSAIRIVFPTFPFSSLNSRFGRTINLPGTVKQIRSHKSLLDPSWSLSDRAVRSRVFYIGLASHYRPSFKARLCCAVWKPSTVEEFSRNTDPMSVLNRYGKQTSMFSFG